MAQRRYALINKPAAASAETNDLTAAVTWANVPDANITQSSVTQHQAALSITESQISDFGSYIATVSSVGGTDHASITRYHTTQGGWSLETNDTDGDITLFQTDSAGNLEDVILHADRNAAVALFWNGTQKFFTDQGGCGTNSGFFLVGSSTYAYTPGAGSGVLWLDSDTDTLYFRNDSGTDFDLAGGGISNLVEDTTPQLGGQLSTNGFDINFDTTGDHALFADTNACIFGTGFDASVTWSGTDIDWALALANGNMRFRDGMHLRIMDSTDTDYLDIHHDGTDVNFTHATTTDWNISGITSIQAGAVDADFDAITATSYGGITEANLLDKSANEVVTGEWSVPAIARNKATSYTMVLGDAGQLVRFTGATASKVCTIPANASVAYPIGTLIAITNDGSVTMTVAITTDTLTWGKDNTTGTRTLAAGADCVIMKTTATTWKINGSALVT